MVWAILISGVDAGFVERGLGGQPGFPLEAVHDYGAFAAVKVARKIGVRFYSVEIGNQLLKVPLIVALRSPRVVVLGHSPQEDLTVYGAGAAGDLATRHHHRPSLVRSLADELPVVVAGHDVRLGGVAEFHFVRQVIEVGVVFARFQQQHRAVGVLGQACGQYGPRRPCANNYHVIFHSSFSQLDC